MTDPHGGDLRHGYERPEQRWVCGHAAEGQACPFGPSPGGRCGATFECVPRRKGDRWNCSRPDARGGPCDSGPLPDGTCGRAIPPCQPIRSLRARRGLLAFVTSALSLGTILWLTGGSSSHQFHSPGDLTFKHGTVTNSCEACHVLPPDRPSDLFQAAAIPHKDSAQTQLCLQCHDLGSHGTSPHGLPAGQLRELTAKAGDRPHHANPLLLAFAKRGLGVPQADDGSLACGTCHREHQGRQFDLSFMDNQRCQACHAQQFASLSDGHPEFRGYPYHRRTAIFFDHQSHIGRHFKDFQNIMPGGQAPQTCADCHHVEPSGRMMVVKNFDQMCASCHLPQVMDTALGGVRFLNLPGLDVATLRTHENLSAWAETITAANALPLQAPLLPALTALFRDEKLVVQSPFPIGEWPAAATGDLTPFMRLLVSADREGADALETLRGVNLCDLRRASLTQIKAAGVLLWRVKELFYDAIHDGDRALTQRLDRLADPPLTPEQQTLLTADLPPSVVWEAQQRWLPALLTEVPNYRSRRPLTAAVPPRTMPAAQPEAVRWRIHNDDCSIQYLPRRHTDLFLRGWLDAAGERFASARSPSFAAVFDTLSSPYSPGRCAKCHGVEARPNDRRVVQWLPAQPVSHERKFTVFAHRPHFSLMGSRQCEACHSLDPGGNYQESFLKPDHTLNLDPTRFTSNFQPMKKADCADCHAPGQASNNCLLCHNYHVGTFSSFRAPPDRFNDGRR